MDDEIFRDLDNAPGEPEHYAELEVRIDRRWIEVCSRFEWVAEKFADNLSALVLEERVKVEDVPALAEAVAYLMARAVVETAIFDRKPLFERFRGFLDMFDKSLLFYQVEAEKILRDFISSSP
jgi:hypothetical protein